MIYLKQSTASQEIPLGLFLDSTDGNTAETGLTIANTDIQLWKSGATTLASKNSGGATHISGGIYYAVLDDTDTATAGPMVIFCHVSGALTVRLETHVLPANVYDSMFSTDKLQVDVVQVGGDTQSATDLKDLADTGYDPSTHKVQGVVLTDTCTTLTGHTAQTGDSFARIGATGSGLTSLASQASVDTVDGIVDSILEDTGTTLPATLTTIDDFLDTEIAAILEDTGTTIPGLIADVADAVWDEALSGHTTAGTAGIALATASSGGVEPSVIAGAVWDAEISSYVTAGTFGAKNQKAVPSETASDYMADVSGLATAVNLATVDTVVDGIQTDLSNGTDGLGALKTILDVIATDTTTDIPGAIAALNDISVADIIAGIADGSYDLQEMMRIMFSVLAGKSSGGGTATLVFKDSAGTTERVTATVDADGNRTGMVLDAS